MSYRDFLQRFLTAVFIIILLIGLWYVRSILILGFAAVLVAVAVSVPSRWLQKRGWRTVWATITSAIGLSIIAFLLGLWIVPTLISETTNLVAGLPAAVESAETTYTTWRNSTEVVQQFLPPLDLDELVTASAEADLDNTTNTLLDFGIAVLPILEGVGSVFTLVANIGVMLFIAAFFLADPKSYVLGSLMLVPQRYHQRVIDIWSALYKTLHTWIEAQTISIGITIFLVWFILGFIMKMENAAIVAVFAGFATFIPNIGAFLPLIPIVIFTLTSNPTQLVWTAPTYLVIQLLESNVITPSIVKAELDIPAGAVMLFQLIATLLFGAVGLLLAVPIMAVVITLVREIYSFDFLKLRDAEVEVSFDENRQLQLGKTAVKQE